MSEREEQAGLAVNKRGISFANIRYQQWYFVFLFPLAIIMGDVRLLDIGVSWLSLDSFVWELIAYSAAVLLFFFLPQKRILPTAKAGSVLIALVLLYQMFLMPDDQLWAYLLYSFADGLCLGFGFFVFFFILNNAERLFSLILVELYFVIGVDYLWLTLDLGAFMMNQAAFVFVLCFLLCIFFTPKEQVPVLAFKQESTNGEKTWFSFVLYALYMVVELLAIYLNYDTSIVEPILYTSASLLAILLVLWVLLTLRVNALHLWNFFLVLSLLAMALLSLDSLLWVNAGSFLYGICRTSGYIIIFYLVGCAARRSYTLQFFRWFCLLEFFVTVVFTPGLESIFSSIGDHYNLIALGLTIVLVCCSLFLSPYLNRHLFFSDWIDDLYSVNLEQYQKQLQEITQSENLNLTYRERQLFLLMLTDVTPKEIAAHLHVSLATVNFHSTNLYRKLGIQSRRELLIKYANHPPQ
ncbi:MAG: helix-turn-helix transcriptional regulator [Erysipelotrichaceae bacterium]|jgi:DNA-binding CsgD family transcriptional regulator|nr:helix-turn-helix transcriptional regulator [Erysipelotrichaceae bacterium]